jgi:hypothetical protein
MRSRYYLARCAASSEWPSVLGFSSTSCARSQRGPRLQLPSRALPRWAQSQILGRPHFLLTRQMASRRIRSTASSRWRLLLRVMLPRSTATAHHRRSINRRDTVLVRESQELCHSCPGWGFPCGPTRSGHRAGGDCSWLALGCVFPRLVPLHGHHRRPGRAPLRCL